MIDCSFNGHCRLKKTFEFRKVREKGSGVKGKIFSLYFIDNGLGRHRLGLSIGRSVVPLASKRARIKRIIREIFRTNRHLVSNGSYDMVVYVKRQSSGVINFESAKIDLLSIMEKIRR